jgi:hypothetical protein
MKIYNPKENDSFEMQFGFKAPNYQPKTVYIKSNYINRKYIKKADKKSNE